jgi:hypothetical protein
VDAEVTDQEGKPNASARRNHPRQAAMVGPTTAMIVDARAYKDPCTPILSRFDLSITSSSIVPE